MAYPEPIPQFRGKAALEFLKRLEKFELTPAQKELYRGCRAAYHNAKRVQHQDV